MQGGASYQNQVAAWLATKMLSEGSPDPIGPRGKVVYLAAETGAAVDDLLVGTESDSYGFIQAKRRLFLSNLPNSPLTDTINQAVRQLASPPESGRRPWSRALNPALDRVILVTSSTSGAPVTTHLRAVLRRVPGLAPTQSLADAATTTEESRALSVVLGHLGREWERETGQPPTEAERRLFLTLFDIDVLDVGPGERDEREAKTELRTVILAPGAQEHLAWNSLVSICTRAAVERTGFSIPMLRCGLREDGIILQGQWSYRSDIEKLRSHTAATLAMLSELSRIRIGGVPLQVDRPAVSEVITMADEASCVIVGLPGAGKSGIVYEAGARLLREERDVVCLAIDKLDLSSLPHLQAELNLGHPVLEVLNQWDGSRKGVLLIDALDGARGDAAADTILSLIQQLENADNRWSIVASVRKWDLRNSPVLRDVFRSSRRSSVSSPPVDPEFFGVNHINIAIFTIDELDSISSRAPALQKLREAADPGMVELLCVPFNLKLAASLLDGGMTPAEFSPLRDQMGLLQAYWDRRVTPVPGGDRREQVLRLALDDMVSHRSLRAERGRTLVGGGDTALEELLSSNVLTEWQPWPSSAPNRHLLAFSHNVLFDFGAEQLTLPHDPEDLVKLVLGHPELVLILRPSFHMRLQRLWTTHRSAFWDLTLRLCSTEDLSSLVQSCPLVVVAENARTQEEVEFLANQLASNISLQRPGVGRAYHHLVGVLISGGRESRPNLGESAGPWISLATAAIVPDEISQMIDAQLWLDAAMTAWEDQTYEQFLQLGLISRRLLATGWTEADRNDVWVIAAIRNVCKTYASDPAASGALLRQALNPNHIKAHGHQELKWIAESASKLASIDPGLVADLYIAAFSWRETAEDSTYLFKSRINGFRSNRRQDYEHARWDLARRFPRLLSADPSRATTALIQIAEVYSRNEHQGSTETEEFHLDGVATGIRTDYASIWDSGGHADENASAILNTYFHDLDQRAADEASAPLVAALVDQLVRGSISAVLWCRLLILSASHPRVAHQIRSAAWAKPLLLAYDTARPMHLFLHALYPTLATEEQVALEDALVSLGDEQYEEYGKSRRDHFLGAISSYPLVTKAAKQRLDDLRAENTLEENAPRQRVVYGGAMQVDPEHFWGLNEADSGTPGNQELLALQQPVREFSAAVHNSVSSLESATKLLPDLEALWCALDPAKPLPPSDERMHAAFALLLEATSKIALIAELVPESELGAFVLKVLDTGSFTLWPEYTPEADRFEGGYGSPSGRLEAAEGLMALARNENFALDKIFPRLQALAKDAVPSVRFQIARRVLTLHDRSEEKMWDLFELMARDRNARIRLEIVHWLDQAARAYPARALGLTKEILDRADAAAERTRDLIGACIASLTGYHVSRADATAGTAILKIVSGLPASAKEAAKIFFPLRNALCYAEPGDAERARGIRERAARLFNQLVTASAPPTRAFIDRRLRGEELTEQEDEEFQDLLHLLTVAGSELYFALGVFQEHSYGSTPEITSPFQPEAYNAVAPSLELMADIGEPQLAHHMVQILEMCIPVDAERAFLRMGKVVQAAKIWGYHKESAAVEVVVRTIRIYIADHRSLFQRNPECLRVLREIMEVFMGAGWPSARSLSYRLDEIFRG
jgi:hypothetical protein